jgi:putative zinc finger/helix-turn-helix YgiT family protein
MPAEMTVTGYCPYCQLENAQPVRRPRVADRRRPDVSFNDELSHCPDCGSEFYTPEQSEASSQARTAALRDANGLPSGDEIRALRTRLNMNLDEFETAFGVGKGTAGRWERGTVPPSASLKFGLWVAMHHRDVFLEFARLQLPNLGQPIGDVVGAISPSPQGDTKAVIMTRVRTRARSKSLPLGRSTSSVATSRGGNGVS